MPKKDDPTLGRMSAPVPTLGRAVPSATLTTAAPSELHPTQTMAIGRMVLLHIRRYALALQERDNGRVTQRDVAEYMLTEYLDNMRDMVTLPPESPNLTRQVNTLALSRSVALRLKRLALDQSERLGRTVSQRELAEAMFISMLNEAGIVVAAIES